MYTVQAVTRRIMDMSKTHHLNYVKRIAQLFEAHDKCLHCHTTNQGTTGVVRRTDGAALRFTLHFDEKHNNRLTAWKYETYETPTSFGNTLTSTRHNDGHHTTIARDIAGTIDNWLGICPIPDPWTRQRDVVKLSKQLIWELDHVRVGFDEDNLEEGFNEETGPSCVIVHLDELTESHAEIRIDYANSGYAVIYTTIDPNDGVTSDTQRYANFDDLVATLQEHGAQPWK